MRACDQLVLLPYHRARVGPLRIPIVVVPSQFCVFGVPYQKNKK